MSTHTRTAATEPVGTDMIRLLKALKLGGRWPTRCPNAQPWPVNTNSATSGSSKYSSPTK